MKSGLDDPQVRPHPHDGTSTPPGVEDADQAGRIFHERWWLDAVSDGAWREASVEREGTTLARLPYFRARRFGLETIVSPPLCPRLGPWLHSSLDSKPFRSTLSVLEELIERLPPADLFIQNFSADVGTAQPFRWHGYSEQTYYSHVIPDVRDVDAVRAMVAKQRRKEIERAARRVAIEPIGDIGELHRLVDASMRAHGARLELPMRALDGAFRAASARGKVLALGAHVPGRSGPVAALFMVWDERRAYYLLGGLDREHAPTQAADVLIWSAIEHASTVTVAFDFEGSMVPGIARFFAGFPGRPQPYSNVQRRSRKAVAALAARGGLAEARRLLGEAHDRSLDALRSRRTAST